jgi:hypothetical protein
MGARSVSWKFESSLFGKEREFTVVLEDRELEIDATARRLDEIKANRLIDTNSWVDPSHPEF